MGIKKQWLSLEEFEKIQGGDWTPEDHTHVKADITDTPWAWADVLKTGSNLTDLVTRQHAALTNILADQHHAQAHTLASHSTKPHSALTDVLANQHHAQDHASRHQLAGADAIKLDDLAEPDNTLDLNSSIARHGLFPKLSNLYYQCLNGIGQWLTLYDSTSIIIGILSKASVNVRNFNDAEKTTLETNYVKIKETKLGEPTGVMRIYFQLKTNDASNQAFARIYKNGVALGTERTTVSESYVPYQQDLGPFDAQDLIQIYAHRAAGGVGQTYVKDFQFLYDRSINMLGECTLATPIALTTQNIFSMQNQDP